MPRELPEDCHEMLLLQHGVLSRPQALQLGIGPKTVSSRLRHGHWQRLAPAAPPALWAAITGVSVVLFTPPAG